MCPVLKQCINYAERDRERERDAVARRNSNKTKQNKTKQKITLGTNSDKRTQVHWCTGSGTKFT
jgi:hypothetical protein